jgi:CubicO group peptidase (beta-lactamase class C family)
MLLHRRFRRFLAFSLVVPLLAACGDNSPIAAFDSGEDAGTDEHPQPSEDGSSDAGDHFTPVDAGDHFTPVDAGDRFAAVDAEAAKAFATGAAPGFCLTVYEGSGHIVFQKSYGDFAPDRRVAVASASKFVSGLVLMRLVDRGVLSLDSTTGEVLGWAGANGSIRLSHLLSFTSGLPREAACTRTLAVTLAQCVDQIAALTAIAPPGERYDYGSTHLHVAARMAEVRTGKEWAAIFAEELREPLGTASDIAYYTAPRQSLGTSNPLIAGGLRASSDEYAPFLALAFRRGLGPSGTRLISDAIFDAQAKNPYPDAVVGYSPLEAGGLDFRYGLAAWLECATPATGCAVISSPGAFGFTPWLDREAGYYAILAMEIDSGATFSVRVEQTLEPLIRAAIKAQ